MLWRIFPAQIDMAKSSAFDGFLYCFVAAVACLQPLLAVLAGVLPLRGRLPVASGIAVALELLALISSGTLFVAGVTAFKAPRSSHKLAAKAIIGEWLFYFPYLAWLMGFDQSANDGTGFSPVFLIPAMMLALATYRAVTMSRAQGTAT
jgi:hypothetical protein